MQLIGWEGFLEDGREMVMKISITYHSHNCSIASQISCEIMVGQLFSDMKFHYFSNGSRNPPLKWKEDDTCVGIGVQSHCKNSLHRDEFSHFLNAPINL